MGGGSGLRSTYHRFGPQWYHGMATADARGTRTSTHRPAVAQRTPRRQHADMAVIWWVVAVPAIFGIVLYSVGQVLLRGPADSEVPKSGGMLMLVGGALVITGVLLAIAHLAFGLF